MRSHLPISLPFKPLFNLISIHIHTHTLTLVFAVREHRISRVCWRRPGVVLDCLCSTSLSLSLSVILHLSLSLSLVVFLWFSCFFFCFSNSAWMLFTIVGWCNSCEGQIRCPIRSRFAVDSQCVRHLYLYLCICICIYVSASTNTYICISFVGCNWPAHLVRGPEGCVCVGGWQASAHRTISWRLHSAKG